MKLRKKVVKCRKPYCYGKCTCSCDPTLYNSSRMYGGTGYN